MINTVPGIPTVPGSQQGELREASWRSRGQDLHSHLSALIILASYDGSGEGDHRLLKEQLVRITDYVRGRAWDVLSKYKLAGKAVTGIEVSQGARAIHAEIDFYIANPLWPTFKYPLSENELTRIEAKLEKHLVAFERRMERITRESKANVPSERIRRRVLRNVMELARYIPFYLVSTRLPPNIAPLAVKQTNHGPIQISWQAPFPNTPEEAKMFLRKLSYFHIGHHVWIQNSFGETE